MKKRRARFLSTLGTARLVGNVLILIAFVTTLIAIVVPPMVQRVLAKRAGEIITDTDALLLKFPTLYGWDIYIIFIICLVFLWAGYLLKTLALLAETQLVDFNADTDEQ